MYNDEILLLEEIGEKFGITFVNKSKKSVKDRRESFVPQTYDDGALITGYGHFSNSSVDFNSSLNNQDKSKLIDTYRRLSQSSYIDIAVEEIVHESIVYSDKQSAVQINLETLDLKQKSKDIIREEFEKIYRMFNFNNKGHDLFRRWYIDGKIHFHMVVDTNNITDGIKEFRFVDPKKIQLVRERKEESTNDSRLMTVSDFDEYFVFSDLSIGGNPSDVVNGLKITKESMVYVTSGNIDYTTGNVMSYLHKAIRPHNLLINMENATVVYKMARAPEKRAFYIDVTGIPGTQVPKYMQKLISTVKSQLEFDPETGTVDAENRFTSMLQDYYLPQRDGKGTSIETVQGSTGFDNMDPVDYFKDKLQLSLNVPKSRYESDSGFSLGREGDITREEVRFAKFISRLRNQFSQIFEQALGFQLKLKKFVTEDEWEKYKQFIGFDFSKDNYWDELTKTTIWQNRAEAASAFENAVEKGIISQEWVNINIWKFTEKEIIQMKKEIKNKEVEDKKNGVDDTSVDNSQETETSDENQEFSQIDV